MEFEIGWHPMRASFTNILLVIVITGIVVFTGAAAVRSDVVVFDDVTTVQTPIHIKVLTKGKFFVRGGRLVDIYLDEVHLKRILTGGDGYGYLKYTHGATGYKSIKASSDGHNASGLHLVTNKSEKTIIIDVEGAFKDAIFSEEIRENSQEVVKALSAGYKIIYVSRYVGKGVSRSWLKMEDFPTSVILAWQGAATIKRIQKRGVLLEAVIGSAAVISAAKRYVSHLYTFEESKDGKVVKDWKEILDDLKPVTEPEDQQDTWPVEEDDLVPP